MLDQMHRNPLTVTGVPALTTGALSVDTNQGLTFDGSTNSFAAVDSASLSQTGSMSVEFFIKVASIPGSTKTIINKSGSYGFQILSTGQIRWFLANGASHIEVDSAAAITPGVWYHVVGVYNQNYNGVQQFGKTSLGASTAQVDDTNGNNKAVSKFTLLESAILNTVVMSFYFVDEIWGVSMNAVVYTDSGGVPATLVTYSPSQYLYPPSPAWRSLTWITFPIATAFVPAGDYHLGFIADTTSIGAFKAPLIIGCAASGGTTSRRPDNLDAPDTSFGSVVSSTAQQYDAYCNYTAVGRSGLEGKASLYVNGALSASSAYTGGIVDSANALVVCETAAASVDEISVWNRALSGVEVGYHYLAR